MQPPERAMSSDSASLLPVAGPGRGLFACLKPRATSRGGPKAAQLGREARGEKGSESSIGCGRASGEKATARMTEGGVS
jgi:hypothetical protein